jgi:predicted metal-dependent hydrolase
MGDGAEFLGLPDNVLWQRALKYYQQHDFFMVHEALEVLWKRSEGQDAEFYQAFLQAAVSLYHYGNANFSGARQLARSAISRLADLPDGFHGVDIKAYLNKYEALMSPVLLSGDDLKPLDCRQAPPIHHL